jgi:hypothetical protein
MSLLLPEDGLSIARDYGNQNMSYGLLYAAGFGVGVIITAAFAMYFTNYYQESNSLTFVSQYTVYNYSTNDGAYKMFLLSKDRLNQSILLTNDNDITDKILITKLPYS